MTALGRDPYDIPAMSPNGIAPASDALLEVKDARVQFGRRRGSPVRAVDGVSFTIGRGETLGLVGESGCGKTTLTRALLGLTPLASGQVLLDGTDIGRLRRRKMRPYRPRIQVVFQDPNSALNPRMTVRQLIGEPLQINHRYRRERIDELLEAVGLSPEVADRRASSFSGGQRQRIGIARALALDPALLILDEPVSALDVSIQAQVINLLKRLQRERHLTYLFIAHDLAVVRYMADHVAVMYLGKVVEYGTRDQIFHDPQHPYTQSLLAAVPVPDPARREEARNRAIIGGDLPDPAHPPSGCHFRTRCPRAQARCAADTPKPDERASGPGHRCACFFPGPPA